MRTARTSLRTLLAAALLGGAASASAATFYWDGATVTANAASGGGAGTWTVGASGWEDGATAVNWADANDAVFGGTAGTVTLGGAISAGTITVNTSGYTFNNGGFNLSATTLTGGGNLTLTGAGTFTVTGSSTYTGNLTISAGKFKMSGGQLYNAGYNNANIVTVNSGGTLELDSFAYGAAGSLGQLADYGARRVLNGGTINIVGSTHSSGNNFNVANGSTGFFNMATSGQTLTLSGNGNSNIAVGGTLTFGGAGNITVNEIIDANGSNGSIVYAGTGTLQFGTLQALNSVTTVTARTGGTIRLNNTNAFVSGHGVALAANRSIVAEGTGSIIFGADFRLGNMTLNNGGTFTSNVAVGGYGVLFANNAGGASTVTVSGTYTAAARMNGTGGMNMQGVQNFAVADINTTATDSGQDLIVSMGLGNPNTSGGDVGGITKSGAGTMLLSNSGNTFSGAVTVNAGTLAASGASDNTNTALGASSGSRTVTVNSGATLAILGNNVFGGGSQTLANTIKVVVNGGTLTTNAYNVIGNVDLNGGTMTATAGSSGSYQTWELNGSTITVGGSAASTMSSTAASSGGYHLAGGKTLTLAVADATSSSATDLTVSAALVNGSNDRTGNGALLKTGAGTLLLSAANTFSGGYTQRAGTVVASNSSALGSGTVTLGDASTGSSDIALLINATAGGITISRDITVAANGSGTVTLGSATTANTNQALFSGAITLNRDVTLSGGTNGDRLGFTGAMTGSQNVTIGGTNRVIFSGTAKAYTGTTTINSGAILQLSDGSSTANTFLADSATLTVNGSLRLAKGGNSETVGGLAGSGTVTAIAGADTLIIGSGNATATFSGSLANAGATLALTKTGTGTQTLTGASTYTGATAVNNGTLALGTGGSLGNTAITVASGATLTTSSGTSIGGSVTVDSGASATISGSITGTTTVAGTLGGFGTLGVTNVSANGKLIAGNGVSGALTVGNLTFAGTGVIDIGAFTNYTSTSAITAGTLTASGAAGSVTINLGGAGAATGSYNLIAFSGGTISGTGLSAFVLGTMPSTTTRQTASLKVVGSVLQYVVEGSTPYWTGLESASWSTAVLAGDGNWKLDTDNSKAQYEVTDAVLFNDLATNTTATIDQANLTPTSVTVTGSKNFTFDGAFGIAAGLISKSGTGVLTIRTANTFAGGTTLSAGRIRVGTDTALGAGVVALNGGALSSDSTAARSLANNVTVGGNLTLGDSTDTGALTLSGTVGLGGSNRTLTIASDATLSGVVSDGALTKAGNGTLTLSGANTFAGGTTLSSGITRAGSATAFGIGSVTLNGGQLDLNSLTLANNVTLTTASLLGSGGISGNLDLGGNAFAPAGNADLTFSGVVSNGSINKTGNGVLTLSGANTYSGGTTLSAGTIRVGSSTAVGNGTLTLGGGRLSSDSTTSRSLSNAVVLTASTTLGDSTRNGALTLSGNLNLGGNGPVLTNDSAVTLSGVVSNGTLRKGGSGTMTLSGANTYTGGTVIETGVLEFSTVADGSASNLGQGSGSTGFIALVNGTLRYTGASSASSSRHIFANNGTGTIDVSQAAGTLTLTPGGGAVDKAFTKSGSGTLDLGGSLVISGSGNTLTVSGGNLILRGAHSYTGATTVAAGATLTLSGANYTRALGTSGITLGSGSTLRVTSMNVLYDAYGEIPITVNGGTIQLSYSAANFHQHLGVVNLNGGTLTATATAAPYNSEYSTLDGAINVGGSSRSVIAGSQAAYTYALNSSGLGRGANVFNVGATGDASGVDLLVSAPLSGGSLRKTGVGVMSLTGANTYTGGTVVDAGTLVVARADTAAGTLAGAITVNNGGTLRIGAQDALGYTGGRGAVTVNAGGTFAINSGLRSTMANSITLNGGSIIGTGNGDTWGHISLFNGSGIVASSDASGNAAVINAIVGLQDSGSLTAFNVTRGVASPVSDLNVTGSLRVMNGSTNGIRKTGTGIMTLTGANTYAGGTTVDNGTLRLASGGRIYSGAYNGSAVVTVNSGAILELQNWGYGLATQSLGGLRANTDAIVVNGGTIRMAASGTTAYGRGVTVNSGGATFDSASGANWLIDSTDVDFAFAYNGNPNLTFTGDGNGTFGKSFSGAGSLTKSGTGIWTLSAASSFTGGVTISGGTLAISNVLALGTGGVTVSGGYLDLGGLNPTNLITLGGGQLLNAQNWAPAQVVLTGNVSSETINALTAPSISFGSGATVNLTGVTKEVVLNGNVTVSGLGSFTGKLVVSGALDLSSEANRPGQGATLELASGGSLNLGSGAAYSGDITYKGGSVSGNFSGNLNVSGTGVSLSGVSTSGGTVVIGADSSANLTGFGGTVRLTGSGGVTAGLSTFAGSLELGAGSRLNLTSSEAPLATISVASGGTLAGSGSAGDTTVASGGTVAPGNSPGNPTFATLTLQGGSALDMEILFSGGGYNTPIAGTDYDTIHVTGALTLSGLTTINLLTLNSNNSGAAGDLQDFDPAASYIFDLIQYGSKSYEGSITQYFTLNLGGATYFDGAQSVAFDPTFFKIVDTGTAIQLQYAPIPEPSTYGLVLGGLALAGAALRRRRAKRA